MVKIPSITKQEHEIAQYLVNQCTAVGISARTDKVGNFIAEVGEKTSSPCILLFGHMDTVAPTLPVRIDRKNNILHGRGSVDAKGPLSTFIKCLYDLRTLKKGRIIVVGAVEEEGRSTGAHHFVKTDLMPDYVFSKDYKLRSIDELEKYINNNQHLPGIPSAQEVKENGLSMVDIQIKLLEKIEEMTLYMIQLKKENDELKSKISEIGEK